MDPRPLLVMIAGPNGSGKTTLAEKLRERLGEQFPTHYLNPDVLKGTSNNCFAHELGSLNSMGCVHETVEMVNF
jgi:Ni2+-binding GTPase involved in maturation of urease and hydrogenase